MSRRVLALLTVTQKGGRHVLLSPGVGLYVQPPDLGEGLVAGSRAGVLRSLGRAIDLLVPEAVSGRVAELLVRDRSTPVAYAQALFVMTPDPRASDSAGLEAFIAATATKATTAATGTNTEGPRSTPPIVAGLDGANDAPGAPGSDSSGPRLADGVYALRAPTAGVFYGRQDPDSPPFLSIGSSFETGQTAGLIEVMKVFSPIVHPGGTLPSPLLVSEVRVVDGEEVRPAQILFVLRAP